MSFHWKGMTDERRMQEVKARLPSMTVREIAADLNTSKGIISGFIFRRIQHPSANPRPLPSFWTPEMDSRLRLEVSNGRSAREIANLLGLGSDRAIHARLKRIGLRMREVQSAIHRAAQHHPVHRSRKWKEPRKLSVVPITSSKPFIDRRIGFECAWIVGDPREPEPHCCGAPTAYDQSWCQAHRGIVYGRPA